MRYALARLVIAVGRMVSALGWMLIPPDRRLGHYIGSTFKHERLIDETDSAYRKRVRRAVSGEGGL